MALSDNLEHYYSLEEASGDAIDAHASTDLTDTNTVGTVAGKVGNARSFATASDEYFSNAGTLGLNSGTTHSISLWAWFNSVSGTFYWLVNQWDGTTGWAIFNINNTIYFEVGVDNVNAASLSGSTWHHIVCTRNGTTLKIYVDGSEVATGTKTIAAGTGGFALGGPDEGGVNSLDGKMDEVGVWSRTLTADEVTELYNSGNGMSYDDIVGGGGITGPLVGAGHLIDGGPLVRGRLVA